MTTATAKTEPPTAHAVLVRAAQRIAAQGWHQGAWFKRAIAGTGDYDTGSPLCLGAACSERTQFGGIEPPTDGPRAEALRLLAEAMPTSEADLLLSNEPLDCIVEWQDSSHRTIEDIWNLVGHAIASAWTTEASGR